LKDSPGCEEGDNVVEKRTHLGYGLANT